MLRYAPIVLALAIAGSAAPPVVGQANAQDSEFVGISMFGEYVPQGGGTDNASADFDGEFDMAGGRICYYLDVMGVREPAGLEIHRGGQGDTGELVAELQIPANSDDETCVEVDGALQREMLADLEAFYMVVTTAGKPGGAVRGQLSD